MAEKVLRSRSVATTSKEVSGSSASESVDTDCVQITDQVTVSDVVGDTTVTDLGELNQQINISAVQWQDMLASLKQVIQAELLTTVSESLEAKLNSACEKLKLENEKLAASLTDKFKSDNEKLRQDTENEFSKISENIETVSVNIEDRVNAHVSSTRKELATSEREINQRSRALVKEINDHKLHVDAAVECVVQNVEQTKEEVNSRVEGLASEVKTVSAAFLADKEKTLSEFHKVNLAISQIRAKIAGSATPQHSSLVRAEDVRQNNCETIGLTQSPSE